MKIRKLLLLLLFTVCCTPLFSQNAQEFGETFDYSFQGYIELKEFNETPDLNDSTWEADKYMFKKVAEGTQKKDGDEFEYVVLQLLKFKSKYEYVYQEINKSKISKMILDGEKNVNNKLSKLNDEIEAQIQRIQKPDITNAQQVNLYWNKVDSLRKMSNDKRTEINNLWLIRKDSLLKKTEPRITHLKILQADNSSKEYKYREKYVDIDDQDKRFWIQKHKFQKYQDQGYIKKSYHIKYQAAYGASLSIPFKIRPETRGKNMKITPEISLGGYIGGRVRLSKYRPVYLYIPVLTAGITTIGINSNNVIDESVTTSSDETDDGLVFARTFSVGTFVELNKFQMGVVCGWDRPGGEIATDWIYKDRLWYSFNIGYNFLRREDSN
jgi:hypothetical protein